MGMKPYCHGRRGCFWLFGSLFGLREPNPKRPPPPPSSPDLATVALSSVVSADFDLGGDGRLWVWDLRWMQEKVHGTESLLFLYTNLFLKHFEITCEPTGADFRYAWKRFDHTDHFG